MITAQENLIQFTIGGETYYAEEGMTWYNWIDSVYSNNRFIKCAYGVCRVDGPSSYGVVPAVAPDNIIIRDTNYIAFHEHGAGGNTGGGVAD